MDVDKQKLNNSLDYVHPTTSRITFNELAKCCNVKRKKAEIQLCYPIVAPQGTERNLQKLLLKDISVHI